jgi:FMN phosphatase YigB (HAD superfamily)
MKPHPEIYHDALRALDLEPQEVVMVGDSLKADVAGAQALGMIAVWRKPRRPNLREEMDGIRPDFVVDELREIPRLACFG